MPGPSRPDGVATRVSWPPSLSASIVELAQGGFHPADLRGERVRRVVARIHQQAVQQVVDRVEAVLADADLGAFLSGVLGGACHDLVDRQFLDRLHRDEDLDDAGGSVPAVWVLGGDDITGVQVRDQPCFGGDVVGQRWGAGCGDHATTRERVTAHRLGRDRQRDREQPGRVWAPRTHRWPAASIRLYGHALVSGAASGWALATRGGSQQKQCCYQGRSALGRGSYVRHRERRLGDLRAGFGGGTLLLVWLKFQL